MRKIFFLLILLSYVALSYSQVFPTDTVVKNGSIDKRINYVYLGDGYLSSQQGTFTTDVTNINNQLFNTTPFREYRNYFNVFQVRVPSVESGAKHARTAPDCPSAASHPVSNPANYFGCKFDVGNIHRLIVPDSANKIFSVLASNFPAYDQVIILANSPFYGGSGGTFATSTTHPSAAEISIHELGHSFGLLADEYWAGPQYAAEKPNMTAQSNPTLVKWSNWVGTNNVGVFPYVGGPTWFRPVQNSQCKMEVLGVPFCSVCREAMIERIHTMVSAIDGVSPANTSPVPISSTTGFRIFQVQPDPNTLKTTWLLDGNVFALNTDTVTIVGGSLPAGNHTLFASVVDTTLLTRANNHATLHTYNVQWNLNIITGISSPELTRANLKVFPNPVAKDLIVKFELEKKADIAIELVSADGKKTIMYQKKNQLPGNYSFTFDAGQHALSNGVYFLVFSLNGNSIAKTLIKIE